MKTLGTENLQSKALIYLSNQVESGLRDFFFYSIIQASLLKKDI